ncbi:MAG: M14 family metallopeptidase [Bdellovibrio sp.]|jgi:carboxypeptidase T
MKIKKCLLYVTLAGLFAVLPIHQAESIDSTQFVLKVRAKDKFERSVVANTGASIEQVGEDWVMVIANLEEKKQLQKLGWVESETTLLSALDFPDADREFHNYSEVKQALDTLVAEFPDLMRLGSIGMTHQGRDIWALKISTNPDFSETKPAVLFLGGHHAREHLSVEVPLRFIQWLMKEYKNGNPRAVRYIETREIHLIPMVNPDGLEYDIEGGRYKTWRKNRAANRDGTFGVDLNRNYSYKWGTGGSSNRPNSETYMGTKPFSEPETQAIKLFIETHQNISTLLSFHTFSELILYPWGHSEAGIGDAKDKAVHEVMARKMATWNKYKPQQSSDLYIASGDLTDWSYGTQKVISFTFELDPASQWGSGGFYPGQGVIQGVVQKNIEPCMYLLEYADNPYRALDAAL